MKMICLLWKYTWCTCFFVVFAVCATFALSVALHDTYANEQLIWFGIFYICMLCGFVAWSDAEEIRTEALKLLAD